MKVIWYSDIIMHMANIKKWRWGIFVAEKILLNWNPGRVCYGLSRIGYTPTSAICDIVDNSVSAEAKNIWIYMKKENEFFAESSMI